MTHNEKEELKPGMIIIDELPPAEKKAEEKMSDDQGQIISEEEMSDQEGQNKGNLYLLIDHSSNKQISEKEAKEYFKKNIYHTVGHDEHGEIIIFDLEKDSILPEVRYMDGFSGGSNRGGEGFNIFGPGFLFILVLAGIYVYFSFFAGDTNTDEIKTTNTGSITSNLINTDGLLPGIGSTNTPVIETPIQTVNLIPVNNCSELQEDVQFLEKQLSTIENRELYLGSQIDILELKNDNLKELNNICTEKSSNYSQQINDLQSENTQTKNQLKQQSKLNLEDNQLFLNIGKDVFKRCESNEADYCKNYLYQFYNLREINE